MSTPIERGAEALSRLDVGPGMQRLNMPTAQGLTRAAFDSIELEALAKAVVRADNDSLAASELGEWSNHLATAIKAHLLSDGGE